ncbi:hypothetical protein ACLB2K_037170 [Fragaria x ananassa]
MAGVDSLDKSWDVYVDFRLFLLDQNKGNYLVFEGKNWFDGNTSWGWPTFITQETFRQVDNGFLKDDACIVEAESNHWGSRQEVFAKMLLGGLHCGGFGAKAR